VNANTANPINVSAIITSMYLDSDIVCTPREGHTTVKFTRPCAWNNPKICDLMEPCRGAAMGTTQPQTARLVVRWFGVAGRYGLRRSPRQRGAQGDVATKGTEFAVEPRLRFYASHRIGLAAVCAAKLFLADSLYQHQLHAPLALRADGWAGLDLWHSRASLYQAGACITLSHRWLRGDAGTKFPLCPGVDLIQATAGRNTGRGR
jgi:hypothetical protein